MTFVQAVWIACAAGFGLETLAYLETMKRGKERNRVGEFFVTLSAALGFAIAVWLAAKWWPR